jgi:hypothetical protein
MGILRSLLLFASLLPAVSPAAARDDFLWPQAIVCRENHAP